ncbi:RNA-binding domain-containing protein [Ramicandelaber brevisporus]|nr:RNA-binding domain-containing protein [Ramicandelaber brevisporus]
MTRIVVKGLPKKINEDRLRSHFAPVGSITDVKLLHAKETGRFRQMCFVGFSNEDEAVKAVQHFNNTFIDTSKITVEKALPVGDPSLQQAWSKHSKNSKVHEFKAHEERRRQELADRQKKQQQQRQNQRSGGGGGGGEGFVSQTQEALASAKSDPKLREFLEVMGGGKAKSKTWANDDVTAVDAPTKNQKTKKEISTVVTTAADSDDDEYNDLPSVASGKVKTAFGGKSKSNESNNGNEEDMEVDKEAAAKENDVSGGNNGSDGESDKDDGDKDNKDDAGNEEESAIDKIRDTGRLFVRNLPYNASESDVRELFSKHGPLSEVHIPIVQETKRSKGMAYVTFMMPDHAVKAYQSLDMQFFMGRLIHVLPGKEKPGNDNNDNADKDGDDINKDSEISIKKQKEARRKAQSGNSFNWNTLFMSQDAVAESISQRLGISKADILLGSNSSDDSSSNVSPAVRLALAETHVILDTKSYLSEQGIELNSFGVTERSDVVILVKNIPFGTTDDDLRVLFGKFGDIGRIVIPPTQTIAIVEFLAPSEARSAFSKLAYKRMRDAPIYLEWAPLGIFKQQYTKNTAAANSGNNGDDNDNEGKASMTSKSKVIAQSAHERLEQLVSGNSASSMDGEGVAGATVFVKNLAFKTTEDTLYKLFNAVAPVRKVTISTNPDPKNPGVRKSRGYGFVEYTNRADAERAIKALNRTDIDGHSIEVKASDRILSSNKVVSSAAAAAMGGKPKKGTANKLICKNVAFEATKNDLRQLFSPYGQLKTLRLPKKYDGSFRGFAFLEFLTDQEAAKAMQSLHHTHFLGRHLVIQYAETEDGAATAEYLQALEDADNDNDNDNNNKVGGDDFISLEQSSTSSKKRAKSTSDASKKSSSKKRVKVSAEDVADMENERKRKAVDSLRNKVGRQFASDTSNASLARKPSSLKVAEALEKGPSTFANNDNDNEDD